MCILFIAIDENPNYPLVIAANRDEYHERPTQPMQYWPGRDNILAGRDLLQGGTWFGVNREGRIAAVTNFRTGGERDAHARSRGELVTRFLANTETTNAFSRRLNLHYKRYNPFNLVFGDLEGLYCFSSMEPLSRCLETGFHSISNGPFDEQWPKMSRGIRALQQAFSGGTELNPEELAIIMQDRTRAEAKLLPDTGLDPQRESELSSIFIQGEKYGTRTTTIMLARPQHFGLYEHNFNKRAEATSSQHFSLVTD